MVYNAVLRQAAGNAIFQFFKQNRNLFPTSIHVLQSAIVKIARKTKVPAGLVLYRGISMDFPKNLLQTKESFAFIGLWVKISHRNKPACCKSNPV